MPNSNREPAEGDVAADSQCASESAGGGESTRVADRDETGRGDPAVVLDRMTDAFFAVDDEWTVTYVNEAAEPILAAAAEASLDESHPATEPGGIEDRNLWEAIPAAVDTQFDEEYRTALERQEVRAFEAEFEPLDTWFEVRAYPSETGVSIYFRDVTERHQREMALRRANERLERQNEQLEEFAGIVSHDLRNPLNVLDGWLDHAERTGNSESFQKCRDAVDRMTELIDDLLTLARAGRVVDDTHQVAVDRVAREAWADVDTAEADLTVETETTVEADRSRLCEVFENLFRNAVEHAGSDVSVTVTETEAGFAVVDDGPGVPQEECEVVFEAGYSTADNGTGFGLNIVSQIADAHGWDVSVSESEGDGACFEFEAVTRPADETALPGRDDSPALE
jgi:signal transduction histidine kinase